MKFLRILAFLAVAIAVPGLVLGELKSVAILFRHGERTVTITMPKYGDSALVRDLGLGQLTLVRLLFNLVPFPLLPYPCP